MTRSLLQTLTDTVASSQTKMACHPSGCKRAVGSCARLDPMVLRRRMLLGFVLALFTGIGIYLRIWSIDGDDFSAGDDRDALRREFEHANMEAMDESAEWRMRYDVEVDRSRQIQDELLKFVFSDWAAMFCWFQFLFCYVKASLAGASRRFSMLQKENMKLQRQFESLKQIKTKGWECKCN
ncbi:unnamed protein product [Musa acuminata var. zebrina]